MTTQPVETHADAGGVPLRPEGGALPADAHFLLIRFGSLGDLVKCTALPRLIKARYPQSRITFVTSEAYLALIRDNPHIDQPIGFERSQGLGGLRALGAKLAQEGVDLVVDIHKSLRSRVLRRLLHAPRVRYSKRTWQRYLLVQWGVNTYDPPRGKEEDFLSGLLPYGVRDDGLGTELFLTRVEADPSLQSRIGGALKSIASWQDQGAPVIGIAPVAAWDLKCWPLAHFRTLMEGIVGDMGGRVVVFGGPGDHGAHALVTGLEPNAVSLVGSTTHLESAYAASLLDLVVSNDTGMTHLSEAAGTDVITLFGPTSRELGYFPSRPGSRVLEREIPCRPCTRMGESRCTHPLPKACLELITPQSALHEVQDYLRQRSDLELRQRGATGPRQQRESAPC